MRMLFAVILSIFISIGIFFGMHLMITSDKQTVKESKKTIQLVYLRDKKDTEIERKKRIKPKEPPKKEPVKKIKIIKTNLNTKVDNNVKIKPFKPITKNIEISAISSLSGAQVDSSGNFYDANSLQTLRKVTPRYPRRAKLKKQSGYVQLSFLISKEGNVSNISVIESNPKGIFEKESIRAIGKWKFKPTKEDKNATITFNFRLTK